MKVNPAGWQVYLLDVLAYFPGHLWQERAERPQPLTARGFAHLSTEQQTEVSSQAAIDCIMKRQRDGSGRIHPVGTLP